MPEPNPRLRIVIIGAGLGGCTAAFCLARHGHQVTVLEQRPSLSPTGGGIMIRPGASRLFINWGLGPDFEAICDTSPSIVIRSVTTGEILQRNVPVDIASSPDWGTDRESTLKLLYTKAVEAGASFIFNAAMSTITDLPSSPTATVTLKDTRSFSAHLIIGADGIRSRTRSQILSDLPSSSIDPIISNNTLFGIRIPQSSFTQSASSSSSLEAHKLTTSPTLNVYIAPSSQYIVARWIHKSARFSALFAPTESTNQPGLWDEKGDITYVRQAYSNANPAIRGVLDMAKTCDRWKLAEMPDLPRWRSKGPARVVLLGDSAHGMLPNAAQGFSQVVEDVGALEYFLENGEGDGRGKGGERDMDMEVVTRLWEGVRKPRVERVKEFANWNTRVFTGEEGMPGLTRGTRRIRKEREGEGEVVKSLKDTIPDMNAPFHTSAFLKWAHDYDVVAECRRFLEEYEEQQERGGSTTRAKL